MGKVIHIDFNGQDLINKYNADVYTSDMKKYQFNVIAASINEAYFNVVGQAALHDISAIRCVAVYTGRAEERVPLITPEKVWTQKETELLIDGGC